MKINIKATNIELTPAIRAYLEDKLASLERVLPPNDESVLINSEVGKETNHHQQGEIFRAEVNLSFSGRHLRAETRNEDLYAAIDEVRDEIIRQVNTNLEKRNTMIRRGGRAIKNMLRGLTPWRRKNK